MVDKDSVNPLFYVGVEEGDCAQFVAKVLRDSGRKIELPSGQWKRLTQEQVIDWSRDYAKKIQGDAEDLDGVLMRVRGSHRVSLGSHIGLYFTVMGNPHVLHQWENYGGLLTPVNRLPQLNLEVCGYYRWRD